MKLFELLNRMSLLEHPTTGVPVHVEISEGELREVEWADFDGNGIVLKFEAPEVEENHAHS